MPISVTIVDQTISPEELGADDIAAIYILRLPFRLRVGENFSFKYDDKTDLFVRNNFAVPSELTTQELLHRMASTTPATPIEALNSDIGIAIWNLGLDSNVLRRIAPDAELINMPSRHFAALCAINDFIVAYQTTTQMLFGGQVLGRLTNTELFDSMKCEIAYIGRFGQVPNWSECFKFADSCGSIVLQQVHGEVGDLPPTLLDGIKRALDLKHEYIFYEFALDAKTRMVNNDYVAALLYSVIAFEGAHAAMLRLGLQSRFMHVLDEEERNKIVESRVADLLRTEGLFVLNQLTPFLFMEENERPSATEIDACATGITMRNAIMHSIKRKGKYRLRQRSNSEIADAYSDVMSVYDKYVRAIEARS
jgi:hypothetical protein